MFNHLGFLTVDMTISGLNTALNGICYVKIHYGTSKPLLNVFKRRLEYIC